jgi:hypothetical protein
MKPLLFVLAAVASCAAPLAAQTTDVSGDTEIAVTYDGEIVSDDSLKGTVDFGGMGSGTFTGKRRK